MPMQKSERRLLGLRRRVTAPSLLGGTREAEGDAKEDKSSASSRFSTSPPSVDNFRSRGSPLIPPFTPIDTTEERNDEDDGKFYRLPSEHFLEVLVEQKSATLPKIPAQPFARSANPHRRMVSFDEECGKRGVRRTTDARTDVARLNALNGSNIASFKHPKTQGTDFMPPSGLEECAAHNSPSRRVLRRANSLPVIVPRCPQTSGQPTGVNTPPKERLSDATGGGKFTTLNYVHSKEQRLPRNDDVSVDDEKFGMICDWLRECEEARTS